MRSMLVTVALALMAAAMLPANGFDTEPAGNRFEGRALLEWLDDDPFIPKMRLMEDLAFHQQDGNIWVVPAGSIVDGRSMPALFNKLMGHPFESGFRKAALSYDFAAKSRQHSWRDAQRMFHDATIAEGVLPIEAKVMYLLLYAKGLRWAVRNTRDCHGRCHSRDQALEWSPVVKDQQVIALVGWVRSEDPSLDEIEHSVDVVTLQKGPHVIGRIADVPKK